MKKQQFGFTLFELLVTITIAGILAAIAIPGMQSILRKNEVDSSLRDIGAALTLARSEAISRGNFVAVCGSANQTSCSGSSTWSTGWIVFVDDGDANLESGEEILQVKQLSVGGSIAVEDADGNAMTGVAFGARGAVAEDVSLTLKVCPQGNDVTAARALLLERSGRLMRSFDLHNTSTDTPDGIFEDVTGTNLTCP